MRKRLIAVLMIFALAFFAAAFIAPQPGVVEAGSKKFTGVKSNYYYKKGKKQTKFSGEITYKKTKYYVICGRAYKESKMKDMLLSVFMNSYEDMTDSVYMSMNGKDFVLIDEAYKDATPKDRTSDETKDSKVMKKANPYIGNENGLHDPSILYKDGYFWMMSGYCENGAFKPMFGYSNDLQNWSYPCPGNGWKGARPTRLPLGKSGKFDNKNFDAAAPDFMVDDDGSVWVVVCLGYFASHHGDDEKYDKCSPYLLHITDMKALVSNLSNAKARSGYGLDYGEPVSATYGQLVPINLPDNCKNRIDAHLYKEGKTYYMSIKRDFITNEIWKIGNLNDCQNSKKWKRVNSNVITGYEGPCLLKFGGKYLYYTDRLEAYPGYAPCGVTGTYVQTSKKLNKGWSNPAEIRTVKKNGKKVKNRHGTVIRVTDKKAIKMILKRARQK